MDTLKDKIMGFWKEKTLNNMITKSIRLEPEIINQIIEIAQAEYPSGKDGNFSMAVRKLIIEALDARG